MLRISTRLAAVVIPALLLVGALTSRQTTAQAPQAAGVVALTNARVIDGTGRPGARAGDDRDAERTDRGSSAPTPRCPPAPSGST